MRFRRNPAFERELRAEPEFQRGLERQADQVKRRTEAIAPRGQTGFYHRSIGVIRVGGTLVVRTKDFAGHMVEWGSVNNPAYAPIRRGVRAAGLRLDELPKP